jgi:DNA-binding MarR family transcriptional regulator
MSRGSRGDDRPDRTDRADREIDARPRVRAEDLPMERLALPRDEARELVEFRGRDYHLTGSDTRALATVGAFRVVPTDDLGDEAGGRDVWHGSWQRLADQGLITREAITDRAGTRHLVVLTREGKALLDAHASPHPDGRRQEFYAGIVKPREIRHDAQLYQLFRSEADHIERDGGRLSRVVLDYELKRDYQSFLNRKDRPDDADVKSDRLAFADEHGLHVIDGHLELPDLRIEYETADGRLEYRDVELVTEHYSRSQLAGKARAGFTLYRFRASEGKRGSPFDPRHAERLV